MFVYKPPAALIILGNMVVLFFGVGFLLVNVLDILAPGNRAGGVMTALWALGTIITDVLYRRSQKRALFDLQVSTIFCVVPSWLVGVGLLFFAAVLHART